MWEKCLNSWITKIREIERVVWFLLENNVGRVTNWFPSLLICDVCCLSVFFLFSKSNDYFYSSLRYSKDPI